MQEYKREDRITYESLLTRAYLRLKEIVDESRNEKRTECEIAPEPKKKEEQVGRHAPTISGQNFDACVKILQSVISFLITCPSSLRVSAYVKLRMMLMCVHAMHGEGLTVCVCEQEKQLEYQIQLAIFARRVGIT